MAENHDKTARWIPFNFKVMIIDEDPTSLVYAAAALKACHFEAESFGNPIEALVQLGVAAKKYDLVLVDVNCTKLPWFYLTERIIENFGIPVITTGIDGHSNTKNESYQHGACFHITKPITVMKMDYIWKKLWMNSPMRKRSRNNEQASSLSETENSVEVGNAKKKAKLFHADSNFDEHTKLRLVWDSKLNKRFQVAVTLLGKDATPTNIIGIMNVAGLSTKHIASHLQKYRWKCEKETKKRGVQPSNVQLPTSPVHAKSMSVHEMRRELLKSLNEARNDEEIMQEHQKQSTDDNHNQKQYEITAMENGPSHNQMNLGLDVPEHQEERAARYNQFVRNFNAMEIAPFHNQMNSSFEHQEESTGQYSLLVKNLSRAMGSVPLHNRMNLAVEHQIESTRQCSQHVRNLSSVMENAPLHNQMNLSFENQEEITGEYSQLVNNLSSATGSAPLNNLTNLGFGIEDNIGSYSQQQYVSNSSNAMENGQLRNPVSLSFDYSSFKVPQPAPFMHSNHQPVDPLCNFNVNSTVVQPYIPVMNHDDSMANNQPLVCMDTNNEYNMDELLGSNNAFEGVQHQDASIMSSFRDADMNFSSGLNNYGNLNFDNDAFLEEMFGNAQVGGAD